MNKFDLLIYDFDGTLYDTRPGLHGVLHQMLTQFGFDPSQHDLKEFVGPPMEWSLAHTVGAPADLVPQMIAYFRPRYQEAALDNLVFFDGILPLLDEMAAKGIEQSVASLKFKPSLTALIAKANLDSRFSVVAGYLPDAPQSKAELISSVLQQSKAKNPLMIGDRYFDLDGAKEAGVPFLGVGYGYAKDDAELSASDYFVADVPALVSFLRQHT
jgi:phosphoglycolate phosphatase